MRFSLGRVLLGAIGSLAWLSVSCLAACGSSTSADARDLHDGNDGPPAMATDADADAAPTDADAAGLGSGCASEGGIFCDDFEAPALDPRWTPSGQPVATARSPRPRPTTQTSPTEAPPIVSSLSLGLAWIGTGNGALSPRRAFFDDVAVGSTDPGCPP